MTSRTRGFTLIELLVVIAIIGILSSVVLASLNSARQKGRDSRRIADIKQLQLALELFYDSCGVYPSTLATSATNSGCPSGTTLGSFIATVPLDPQTKAAYKYAALGSGTVCSNYHIGAVLETDHSALGTDADVAVQTACTGGGTDFHGNSVACGASSGSPERCYDARP